MSEQVWLTLLTGALGLFGISLGILGRAVWTEIREHGRRVGDLESFRARFDATESAWNLWRESFITETVGRRADTAKRLDSHSEDLKTQDRRITKLERNGH